MIKVAILITTFNRDELLYKAIQRLVDLNLKDCIVLVGDQGNISEDKRNYYNNLKSEKFDWIELPFDCGLSYGRNRLVELAKEKDCEYCIVSADSIVFNKSLKNIANLFYLFDNNKKLGKIGFQLNNRIGWEGWLSIIKNESFKLEFIDKSKYKIDNVINAKIIPCNICKNVFIAKTESLIDIKYDENLKLMEHEDHCIRYYNKYLTLWTDLISADYINFKPESYNIYRRRMYGEFMKVLLKKYNFKKWILYVGLENAKKMY